MPEGYGQISLPDNIIGAIDQAIEASAGTINEYRSRADFVKDAVRRRVEELQKKSIAP